MQQQQQHLAAVRALARVTPALTTLPHVLDAIDAFADVSVLFLIQRAVERQDACLLDRILQHYERGNTRVAKIADIEFRGDDSFDSVARFRTVLRAAAQENRVRVLRYVLAARPDTQVADAMVAAASAGHLDALRFMHDRAENFTGFKTCLMDAAARHGRLRVLQWLHTHRSRECTVDAMNRAAQFGHLNIVQWLHTNRTEGCTAVAMDYAAQSGHLDVVQWLHMNRSEGCTKWAMNRAALTGHLDVVRWLHEHREEGCTIDAMDGAAANGHLHVVQWLHTHRSEGCTKHAMNRAATNGHLEVVQWLHDHRSEGCSPLAMNRAAANGHLHVVRWLHAYRSEGCTSVAMDDAARNGDLAMLTWLHENRCEGWSPKAVKLAEANSHLDVTHWLQAHSLPRSRVTSLCEMHVSTTSQDAETQMQCREYVPFR